MVSPGWCWSAGAQGCGMVCPVAGPKPGGQWLTCGMGLIPWGFEAGRCPLVSAAGFQSFWLQGPMGSRV